MCRISSQIIEVESNELIKKTLEFELGFRSKFPKVPRLSEGLPSLGTAWLGTIGLSGGDDAVDV